METTDQRDIDLAQELADILTCLLENGFEPPFHAAMLGTNGAGFLVTYEDRRAEGEGLKAIVRYEPSGPLKTPINMMFVDQRGEAARVYLGPSGRRITTLH